MFSNRPTSPPAAPGRQRVLILMTAIALVVVAACGKKGDPLPPLRNIPIHIDDLQIRQLGSELMFDMAYPATTAAGMTLGGVDGVELYEVSRPLAPDWLMGDPLPTAEPAQFAAAGEPLLTLRGAELSAAIVGDRIQFRLPLSAPEAELTEATVYAVKTTKLDEKSALSNRVTLVVTPPPAAPEDLGIEARPSAIALTWAYDGEVEAFDVFRRDAQSRAYDQPLRRVDGDQREFMDRRAEFGKQYIYTVRAIGSTLPLVYSDPAGEREIDYADRFPPRLPGNFVALPERGAVRLRWDASPDDDLAGYILYRRDPGQARFVRLNTEPLTATEYLDRGLASGLEFEFRIQVIDKSGNEGRLGPPISATTR